MKPQPTHRTKPSRSKFALFWRSWRHARFFPAVLIQRTLSTLPSVPRKEIAPDAQVRRLRARRAKAPELGDTIVEVLIAIAVISLVLAGAYVTTNRSLLSTRAAEERGNAIKLVESQLEQLKSISRTDPDSVFGSGVPNPFCITQTLSVAADSDAACQVDSAGEPTSAEPIYRLSISRDGPDSNDGYVFTATSEWVDPSGDMTDRVRTIYRIYDNR